MVESQHTAAASAVQALEAAARKAPKNARILNDLAVAYFMRAYEEDEPQDLVRALDAAARARECDPALIEARFNLALILERLHLRGMARATWSAYIKLDGDSGWGEEARRRRDAFGAPSIPVRWKDKISNLRASALRANIEAVKEVVRINPQAAREYAMEELLGEWGGRLADGDAKGAARELRIAREVGDALISVSGESTITLAVEAIEQASGDFNRERTLSGGHQVFRAGMRSFRELKNREAHRHFKRASELFAAQDTPMRLWSIAGEARCLAYNSEFGDAESLFRQVLKKAQDQGLSSLEAWCHWGLGWIQERQGHLAESLSSMITAREHYTVLREAENEATIRSYIADRFFTLGQSKPAWRDRYQALRQLSQFPESWRWHIVLVDGARAAMAEEFSRAALLFQEEGLLAAQAATDNIRIAEAYWSKSKIHAALGHWREAQDNVRSAEIYARSANAEAPREKLLADVALARGQVFDRIAPEVALASIAEALESYRVMGVVPGIAYASLSRSMVHRRLGHDLEAEADLVTALRLLEDPGSQGLDPDLQLSYAETLQDIYDGWIDFQWERRRDSQAALYGIERARAFPRRWKVDGGKLLSLVQASGFRDQLPERTVFVEYAVLRNRLLIWCIDSNGMEAFEQQVTEAEVTEAVNSFLHAILSGSKEGDILRQASALYRLLIPKPVSELDGEEAIYFIPDKILNRVPFAALMNDLTNRFLIEDHPVSVSPSLVDLLRYPWASANADLSSALLVGDPAFDQRLMALPDLPGARFELDAMQMIFPKRRVLIGVDATKERLLEELDRHQVFVFAGHAVSNLAYPSRSYLVLASMNGDGTSGLLFGSELLGRRFRRLRLVILSACSSIGPRASRSSGLAGMARFFLDAGAEAVVGTLWSIEDREAVPLLLGFYRNVAAGLQIAEALRGAQVEMLREGGRDAHQIRMWSAFEVVLGGVKGL